jgi:hypothetical protein
MSLYYIYRLSNENSCEYFFTRTHKAKAIYALKNSKKSSIIKTILHGEYKCEMVTAYHNVTREFIKNELQLFYAHNGKIKHVDYAKKQTDNVKYENIKIHNNTKKLNLCYGLSRQELNFNLLNTHYFKNELKQAIYKHSEFDFYHLDSHTLIELKCLTYPINKYTTAVMNTSKLIYDKYLFIFEYMEDDKPNLYFHHYDPNRNYNKRFITPKNRLNSCEVIDIPVKELRPITDLYKDTYLDVQFYSSISDRVKFSELIFLDKTLI